MSRLWLWLDSKSTTTTTDESNLESFSNLIFPPQVKLDRVLGLTVSNNASLDCDPYSGVVVYPSGCVLVLYNQRRNKQKHIINSLKKPITACKYSADGKYIVTGEVSGISVCLNEKLIILFLLVAQCGHQPQVRVWEVSSGEQLASLSGHKHGINCVVSNPFCPPAAQPVINRWSL